MILSPGAGRYLRKNWKEGSSEFWYGWKCILPGGQSKTLSDPARCHDDFIPNGFYTFKFVGMYLGIIPI